MNQVVLLSAAGPERSQALLTALGATSTEPGSFDLRLDNKYYSATLSVVMLDLADVASAAMRLSEVELGESAVVIIAIDETREESIATALGILRAYPDPDAEDTEPDAEGEADSPPPGLALGPLLPSLAGLFSGSEFTLLAGTPPEMEDASPSPAATALAQEAHRLLLEFVPWFSASAAGHESDLEEEEAFFGRDFGRDRLVSALESHAWPEMTMKPRPAPGSANRVQAEEAPSSSVIDRQETTRVMRTLASALAMKDSGMANDRKQRAHMIEHISSMMMQHFHESDSDEAN
ncbi:hypothetical protein H696_03757 [Fonticula alba]|uniref:Uncharacterized protein n=1 Tax=Fonticula alba TaxID=691883 RepID=A0A058Z4X4_FONAL|nr:hypothetical protein H696_03757 [Fonticula alba]KCV69325.1 hypothetical protein H696_03757 [Fonticula alba]|eukprot:XP_009495890.1 hypothetical protein H696_03757 [Fonticula alba]